MHISKTLAAALVSLAFAAGCDDCDRQPNVPDPNVGTNPVNKTNPVHKSAGIGKLAKGGETEEHVELDEAPADDGAKMQRTPPLAEAFDAPEDAVTSEGRFAALMEEGMADYLPEKGLVFAMGGVKVPTVRIVVDDHGEVRWARGEGTYWDELSETGTATLDEAQRKKLADIVQNLWGDEELDYPPSTPNRGELLVIRDGAVARVAEGSYSPKEVRPLREMLVQLLR
ncbi:hypothetical protein FIV42_15140 [Persicimonas caeni]|uniref:Lipoprotein n=2 Tax=Persicimonas caeni TaxID=2292766 RepID=A0A4Y6PVL1_PERCE|nr:hypothetical protein [Persicimonas caeni]QDG52027.1 hypothetical protein FIV42_15140 [Persicimonas caeni]QED33248.1 hypothetical protein FRD00_15135 [Persicimonas caeni]